MVDRNPGPKERILAAAIAILAEEADPERITVRQVADKAGVAVGAINYHFQSKENLLGLALGQVIGEVAAPWYAVGSNTDVDPVMCIKQVVRESSAVAVRYRKLATMALSRDLLSGDMTVPSLVVPLLREHYGSRKTEVEVRLMAFQLITALQAAFVRADAFRLYAGIDLLNDTQRNAAVDLIVETALRD